MDSNELKELLDFTIDLARDAGRLSLEYFNTDISVELKPDASPVTIADRNAEELMRSRIEKAFPAHGILGEEFGEKQGTGPGRWILDPIDGTFSFICGVPLFCNLVAFEWKGDSVVGVINVPAIKELAAAAKGLGCTWNGLAAHVSDVDTLSKARMSTTTVKLIIKNNRYPAYRRLLDACAAERGWSDAYAYVLLATGRVDIVLDSIMSIWDVAPLLPVITEAGGTLTDWSGKTTHTAPEAVATNGKLFEQVMQVIRPDA